MLVGVGNLSMSGYGSPDRPALRGRDRICRRLVGMVEAIRGGDGDALVLRGEPGIGKSTLLEHATQIATGARVARVAAVESEAAIPFAGLEELCAPMLDRAEKLPPPQREALRLVFGLDQGREPDRLVLGLAVLGLLAAVGREQPLLCAVDDAQWLDRASAQILEFVGRRLGGEPVGLLVAVRSADCAPGSMAEFAGLEELDVDRFGEPDARGLLAAVARVPLDEGVCDRLIVECDGNPAALTSISPTDVAAGLGLTGRLARSGGLAAEDRRQLESLPAAARKLLLLAAAEPLGDPVLLARAAQSLGIDEKSAAAGDAAGLIRLGQRVCFRTPSQRTAVYEEAAPAERRAAHRALARSVDPLLDADRRAWHQAEASERADETLAAELTACAGRARAAGRPGDAAAFLERASELTRKPALRAERALAAAEAVREAGATDRALELLTAADLRPLDGHGRARLDRLRGSIELDRRRGVDAFPVLRRAAEMLAPIDRGLARETYREALRAAHHAGRFLDDAAVAGVPGEIRTACADSLPDADGCRVRAARRVERARRKGAVSALPSALTDQAVALLMAGEFGSAAGAVEEAGAIAVSSGTAALPHASILLAAWRGRKAEAERLFETCRKDGVARREGLLLTVVDYADAVLNNGFGRYPLALAAAAKAVEHEDLSYFCWAVPELIESASRSGHPEQAAAAFERLREQVRPGGGEWARGMEARSRALLLREDPFAENHYRDAVGRLERSGAAVHLARAHLLYGEWLRRQARRIDARGQLRRALRMFMSMGAQAFAGRAEHELATTAETACARTVENVDELTAQEETVARLAREGFSNPEIGTRLFISPRTVEYHLRKVFRKLEIHSRHELGGALAPS
jgi:DNA-binding CsgD family transcriptional regulator